MNNYTITCTVQDPTVAALIATAISHETLKCDAPATITLTTITPQGRPATLTGDATQIGQAAETLAHMQEQALLTAPQVARMLQISERKLQDLRYEKKGPEHLTIGTLVRYPKTGVEKWINQQANN